MKKKKRTGKKKCCPSWSIPISIPPPGHPSGVHALFRINKIITYNNNNNLFFLAFLGRCIFLNPVYYVQFLHSSIKYKRSENGEAEGSAAVMLTRRMSWAEKQDLSQHSGAWHGNTWGGDHLTTSDLIFD